MRHLTFKKFILVRVGWPKRERYHSAKLRSNAPCAIKVRSKQTKVSSNLGVADGKFVSTSAVAEVRDKAVDAGRE